MASTVGGSLSAWSLLPQVEKVPDRADEVPSVKLERAAAKGSSLSLSRDRKPAAHKEACTFLASNRQKRSTYCWVSPNEFFLRLGVFPCYKELASSPRNA